MPCRNWACTYRTGRPCDRNHFRYVAVGAWRRAPQTVIEMPAQGESRGGSRNTIHLPKYDGEQTIREKIHILRDGRDERRARRPAGHAPRPGRESATWSGARGTRGEAEASASPRQPPPCDASERARPELPHTPFSTARQPHPDTANLHTQSMERTPLGVLKRRRSHTSNSGLITRAPAAEVSSRARIEVAQKD